MPLESGKIRPASPTGAHPPESEHHPCPRCESTNTKFCYYNNYNLSQPRHFCKSCRRYWTRGGALRNIPVGGGTRKRSRAATNTVAASSSSSSSSISTHDPKPGTPIAMVPGFIKSEMGAPVSVGVNLNQIAGPESGGFWGFGGLGLGFGPGFPEMGFGLAPPVWPMEQIGEVNGGGGGGGSVSGGSSGCNTWQMGGVDGGLADGDCFGWPDLSISTPGKCLK